MPISCEQVGESENRDSLSKRRESGLARVHLCPLFANHLSCKLKVHSCTTRTRCCTATFLLSIFITITIIINIFAFKLSLSQVDPLQVCQTVSIFSLSSESSPPQVSLTLIGLSLSTLSSLLPICLFGRLVAYLAGQRIAFTDFINSLSPPTSPSDTIHRDIIRRCSFPSSHLHCPFPRSRRRPCYFRFSISYLATDCQTALQCADYVCWSSSSTRKCASSPF